MNLLINFLTLVAAGHLILCAIAAIATAGHRTKALNSGAVRLALLSVCWLIARLLWW